MPPSKGIVSSWAQDRMDKSPLAHGQAPVPPDFDDLGLDPIHVPEDEPAPADDDQKEPILDFRAQALELTPEQLVAFQAPDALLQLDVPDWLQPRAKAMMGKKGEKNTPGGPEG